MIAYKNNIPYIWQKHDKDRYVLKSLLSMLDNRIVPFSSDWFGAIAGLTLSTQKIYKYEQNQLSYLGVGDDITSYRDSGSVTTFAIPLETIDDLSRWYFEGNFISNLENGIYAIEFTDSAGQIFTTELFKVCQAVASAETNYLLLQPSIRWNSNGNLLKHS